MTATRNSDKKFILLIESARGFAAFYILFHHTLFLLGEDALFLRNEFVHLMYQASRAFTTHILMLFFLLSGFAIHYANSRRITSLRSPSIRLYFYKRFRRIYPIYFLAVAISIAAIMLLDLLKKGEEWPYPSVAQIIGTILVFSDLASRTGTWIATLSTNGPLWSLSYEALYYLMYPLFSTILAARGLRTAILSAASVSVVSISAAVIYGPTQITNMLSLYILWCLGALLAELKLRNCTLKIPPSILFCSMIAWIQSLWIFESYFLWRIPSAFSLYTGLCLFILMTFPFFQNTATKWSRGQRACCFVLNTMIFCSSIAFAHFFETTKDFNFFFARTLLVFVAANFWLINSPIQPYLWGRKFLAPWASTGAYSYALYILQFPILITSLVVMEQILHSPLIGGMIGVVLSIMASKLVERKMQPLAARSLDKLSLKFGVKISGETEVSSP